MPGNINSGAGAGSNKRKTRKPRKPTSNWGYHYRLKLITEIDPSAITTSDGETKVKISGWNKACGAIKDKGCPVAWDARIAFARSAWFKEEGEYFILIKPSEVTAPPRYLSEVRVMLGERSSGKTLEIREATNKRQRANGFVGQFAPNNYLDYYYNNSVVLKDMGKKNIGKPGLEPSDVEANWLSNDFDLSGRFLWNQELSEPLWNQELSEPLWNQELSEPLWNQELSGPLWNQ